MTPEQINIAIAEVLDIPVRVCMCGDHEDKHQRGWAGHSFVPMCETPPNYYGDLNAMHEAEKVMGFNLERVPNQLTKAYREHIMAVCLRDRTNDIFCATAAQRAEAFLRTIGKWEEAK